MTDNEVLITKASGRQEAFSEAKLRHSLARVGAPPEVIDAIAERIRAGLTAGTSTRQIYQKAFKLLRQRYRPSAARYNLRQAIMDLGPTGHPFEKLVGELLRYLGYTVEVAVMVPGTCVVHEVDVVARKDDRQVMVECKFHNEPGERSDIKVALYVWARFEDIEKAWQARDEKTVRLHEAWLVTNTKLTEEAIRYAECVGLKAIGWSYPPGHGLAELIEKAGLHPLTAVTGLSQAQKQQLLKKGIILCKEVSAEILRGIGIGENKIDGILSEAQEICHKKG
jgi:hypothetical protein